MSLTNIDLVSLSGKTSMFESVRGGKRGYRKSRVGPRKKKTYARKSRSLKKTIKICARCKKKS